MSISIQLCLHYIPLTAAWVFWFYILVLCVLETLSITLTPVLGNTEIWALYHVIPCLWDTEQYLCLTSNLAWISESHSLPDYCLHWVKWASTMPDVFFSCFGIAWLPQTCKKRKIPLPWQKMCWDFHSMCLEFIILGPDSKQHYKVGDSYRCSKAVKFSHTHTQAPRPASFKPSQQLLLDVALIYPLLLH